MIDKESNYYLYCYYKGLFSNLPYNDQIECAILSYSEFCKIEDKQAYINKMINRIKSKNIEEERW